ncbi:NAD(P)/FAD-dependent oxidoreductase [Nocardioidaceae bacterium]|nr:NAD(P)/FAD-dependent oxidoreductase [Nocardioidaceae bacterium]
MSPTAPSAASSGHLAGTYDVVVVGGGHNALVAAAYLGRAGRSVLVLERLDQPGGAAVSGSPFPGKDVRLSRYSYLVSLLPQRVLDDLGVRLELRSRRTASYTPVLRDGVAGGLLVERPEGQATRESFAAVTGGDEAYDAWQRWGADAERLARAVEPTLTRPLPRASDLRDAVGHEVWDDLVERPLGDVLVERFVDEVVRGVVATDALIGTFTDLHSPERLANRCFLYHAIGGATGEWRVPVGGMGAVSAALAEAASRHGAEVRTGCDVEAVDASVDGVAVRFAGPDGVSTVRAAHVLAGVSPAELRRLRGVSEPATGPAGAGPTGAVEGSQLKINILVDRLPRLRSGVDPAVAFAGTFHVAETWDELDRSRAEALAGELPSRPCGELYCHSLTDDSILGADLRGSGTHTLTWFGLNTPAALFSGDGERRAAVRDEAVRRVIAAVDEHLAEPLGACLATDAEGRPCLEALVPQDLEDQLRLPGGHIFHGDLGWPWRSDDETPRTPAEAWGVATDHPRLLLCGSGAVRGGAVSGIGGHNAAHALLETASG